MSFQAYIANIETKTGRSIDALKAEAHRRGLAGAALKASAITAWLKQDYGLGHGHAMAVYAVLKAERDGSSGCGS